MFVEYLSREEKEVFYSLALDLVKVDDDFSDEEKERIRILAFKALGEEGYNVECLNGDITILDSSPKKKIVLTELVSLSYIDGVYCEKEKEYIHNLASRLRIETSVMDEIEKWVLESVNNLQKGIDLINKI